MAIRYSTGQLNSILDKIKADQAGMFIDIYSGGQPSDADKAPQGTLLATATLDNDGVTGLTFDPPVGKIMEKPAAANWQYKGLAVGTAGWFRVRTGADDNSVSTTFPRIDGNVGVNSGDLKISNVNITVNAPGTIDIAKITLS